MVFLHHILCMIFQEKCFSLNNQILLSDCIYFLRCWVKAPEHEYIFSKYSWNLIENIILIIFRRVAWNYFNNCLRICVFIYVCFRKQKEIPQFKYIFFKLIKNFEFQIKLVWFEMWNSKSWLTSENEVFHISDIL